MVYMKPLHEADDVARAAGMTAGGGVTPDSTPHDGTELSLPNGGFAEPDRRVIDRYRSG